MLRQGQGASITAWNPPPRHPHATLRSRNYAPRGGCVATFRTVTVGSTAAALFAGVLVLAPGALADNYAPELPAPSQGQINNPPTAQPIGPPGSGIVIAAAAAAENARPVELPPPANRAADAPVASVPAGRAVAPVVQDLPPATQLRASVVIDGQRVDLGRVRTSAEGTVTLPAMRGQAGTTMTVRMVDPDGQAFFVKVRFAKRR